jgi:hypothetical protein
MKTKLTIAILVLAGGIVFFANPLFAANVTTNSVSQTNEPSPFQIIVTPRKTRVHAGEKFKVGLEVKNVSNTNQTFKVWSCSWDENWRSSNPDVYLPGWACRANWVGDVSLAPGESFKETLNREEMEMCVPQSVTTNKVIFRMGLLLAHGEKYTFMILPQKMFIQISGGLKIKKILIGAMKLQ